jgi:O-antigen ligase
MSLVWKSFSASRIRRRKFISSNLDLVVALYSLLMLSLAFRNPSLTSILRDMLYTFLSIIVPYYAISRYVRSVGDFRRIYIALLFSGVILSFIAIMEAQTQWWLYNPLRDLFGSFWASQDFRSGTIRVIATMVSPIELGYFLVVTLGGIIFLKDTIGFKKITFISTLLLILAALFFTDSRGAWLMAVALISLYYFLKKFHRYFYVLILAGIGVIVPTVSFVFTYDWSEFDPYGTFQFRLELIEVSIEAAKKYLFFGTPDIIATGALDVMKRNDHIDIVNTYLQVTFHSGIVGLTLFLAVFISAIRCSYKTSIKAAKRKNKELFLLGNSLVAILVATLIMITTVSSIGFIPIYYWAFIALTEAYSGLQKNEKAIARSTYSRKLVY